MINFEGIGIKFKFLNPMEIKDVKKVKQTRQNKVEN